ncbi:6-phosphofructokinase [hydrothermal vent metagenome]|uniref:6-phosphofructokinase n=1 Tax=hydrothermal vent metagenome TaxID=652676 RepID=A0A3B0V4C0_9ZZZZ
MINGVIAAKLQSFEEVLNELRSLGEIDVAQLQNDWRTQRAVERNLQVLVEIAIDLCQRFIALLSQSPATTGTDAIERCIQLNILTDKPDYRQMVRFRNFIVHRYDRIDPAVLVDVVNNQLPVFEQFRDEILTYVKKN